VIKPSTRVLSITVAALLLGCGASAPPPEDEAKKLERQRSFVQAVACLSEATEKECRPGLAVAFDPPWVRRQESRRTGEIWCEGGRPHVRIAEPKGEITGEFGQVVWEAIWRVLKATGGCASYEGAHLTVTGDGQTSTCDEPRFDLRSLVDMAVWMARRGPPVTFHAPAHDICEADPDRCVDTGTMCPRFFGDPWNGVRAPPRQEAAAAPDPEKDAGESATVGDGAQPPERPSQREIQKALAPAVQDAHRCLQANAGPARAQLVFQSDGAVRSVKVADAEPPAAACIQKALRQARVRPFGDASFSVHVVIRR
jgi:hypothetical protein